MPDTPTLPADRIAAVRGEASTGEALDHLPALDGLRGIAVALVLWHHIPDLFGAPSGRLWATAAWGWAGVDLFFVLSGFLITSILLRSRETPGGLRTFWLRRALRIMPLAYLYLFVLYFLSDQVAVLVPLHHLDGWWMYFFYLANFHVAQHGWPLGPLAILWSLAIEEQFYAVWPFVVRWLTPWRLLAACAAIVLVTPLVRTFVTLRWGYPADAVLTFCRLDGLAAGAILAVLVSVDAFRVTTLRLCRQLAPYAALVVLAIMFIPEVKTSPLKATWQFALVGYSVFALAFACLVGAAVKPGPTLRRILTWSPLMVVGRVSYGLYLWHFLIGLVIARSAPIPPAGSAGWFLRIGLWFACTAVVVGCSWLLFEMPLLRLKRWIPAGKIPAGRGPGSGAGRRDDAGEADTRSPGLAVQPLSVVGPELV